MSRSQAPPFVRKTSTPWDRLRPVKQDPLDVMGLVSKGDNRLLDIKNQESYYQKIVERYMQFCTHHKSDLDAAFASLSLSEDPTALSAHSKTSDPSRGSTRSTTTSTTTSKALSASKWASTPTSTPPPPSPSPEDELSKMLMALRKLREGLLAGSATAASPVFSQRVHVFNVRVAILALHPPSYHPSLSYLLSVLHTKRHPLPDAELKEMTTYMVLDLALRQSELVAAFALRFYSRKQFGYTDRSVDAILKAVVTNDWVLFWRTHKHVDGYLRAMMHWHIEVVRSATLKTLGRAYMKADLKWVLNSTSGGMLTWEQLAAKEAIGWSREGDNVIIRKPKSKP